MIRSIVLRLLLCAQVSLAQTRSDTLSAPILQTHSTNNFYQGFKKPESDLSIKTILLPRNTLKPLPTSLNTPKYFNIGSFNTGSLVAPGFLLGAGFLTLNNPEYLESNEAVQQQINGHFGNFHSRLDNYTQYLPLATVYGLNVVGIKGKNDLLNVTMLYALSSFINSTITKNLKTITKERRPDAQSYDAFPSGHTSTAFANAEIMHQEFKHLSPWYSVAGYSFGVATGSMRMLNNRHWLSDVVAGAGVGILSTHLAYFIYPLLKEKINTALLGKEKFMLAPMYLDGSYGLTLGLNLNQKHHLHNHKYKHLSATPTPSS